MRQANRHNSFWCWRTTVSRAAVSRGGGVQVTNLDNGRSRPVRINDRGPFVGGRIIDLPYASARVLDMVDDGLAPGHILLLRTPPSRPAARPPARTPPG